jgi:hypothetical protein
MAPAGPSAAAANTKFPKSFSGSASTSSLKNDPYKDFKPLLVIPSEEGLISQYLRVTGFLEKAKEHNRSLVLFPFVSHHYQDISHSVLTTGGRIHLCDIFYFPYNLVTCYHTGNTPATITSVLQENRCAKYQVFHTKNIKNI